MIVIIKCVLKVDLVVCPAVLALSLLISLSLGSGRDTLFGVAVFVLDLANLSSTFGVVHSNLGIKISRFKMTGTRNLENLR